MNNPVFLIINDFFNSNVILPGKLASRNPVLRVNSSANTLLRIRHIQ